MEIVLNSVPEIHACLEVSDKEFWDYWYSLTIEERLEYMRSDISEWRNTTYRPSII